MCVGTPKYILSFVLYCTPSEVLAGTNQRSMREADRERDGKKKEPRREATLGMEIDRISAISPLPAFQGANANDRCEGEQGEEEAEKVEREKGKFPGRCCEPSLVRVHLSYITGNLSLGCCRNRSEEEDEEARGRQGGG